MDGRSREDYYVAHERPKQLWVRELRAGARTILRGRNLPQALVAVEKCAVAECTQPAAELERMRQFFERVPDWRKKRGDYTVGSLVAVAVCAC